MKAICLLFLLMTVFVLTGCMLAQNGMTHEEIKAFHSEHSHFFKKTITKELSAKYLVVLPNGYNQKDEWPLIFFLHGKGEGGDELEKVKIHGPIKYAQKHKDFPFILVYPQCPKDEWWSSEVLIYLLDDVLARYNIDEKRIYLTGLSMGGFGSWDLGSRYPERFAAIAPVCGGGESFFVWRLRDIPVWAFHGARDFVVPHRRSEEMVEALKASGGNVKFTLYPELGHDCWIETYNNPALYEWFLEHSKK